MTGDSIFTGVHTPASFCFIWFLRIRRSNLTLVHKYFVDHSFNCMCPAVGWCPAPGESLPHAHWPWDSLWVPATLVWIKQVQKMSEWEITVCCIIVLVLWNKPSSRWVTTVGSLYSVLLLTLFWSAVKYTWIWRHSESHWFATHLITGIKTHSSLYTSWSVVY